MYFSTNWTMASKAIRMGSNSVEAREYIRSARAITTPSVTIPDDVVPKVEKRDEWVMVTFPYINDRYKYTKPPWSDYYAEVIIEAKTKAIQVITLNEDLANKDARSAEDFTPLIAESKAAPTTRRTFVSDYEEDVIIALHSYVAPKRIRLDPGDEKVAEYVRIARAASDPAAETVPVAVIQGDTITVTFTYNRPRIGGVIEVFIDIKTKTVLEVQVGV
jgi:hypothetical protein